MKKSLYAVLALILLILGTILVKNGKVKIAIADSNKVIPVLMYHHIVEDENEANKITLTSKRFEEDMEYLKTKGYTTISFKELIDYSEGNNNLPDKPVIITFDDGYEDNYINAYPILNKNNMKATIFVIGSRIGITNFNNDPRYSYMSWGQAKEMYQSGLIEIQPHSYDLHHYKTNAKHGQGVLPKDKENEKEHYNRFLVDTEKVMKLIKDNVGSESYVYAYPYGKYNATNEEVLKALNFKVTLTTKSQYADISNGLYKLKRINVPCNKKLRELLLY
ncbi:polysaccharide deacetylase family protein [Anaerosalibacter sp. Marseille-P3206]|uniref:polysaccharide deacetylase family protein n=1 Tax=Anaerosalibacter sp. Marseille-P3206 TaxID=1871005 RepID=UPI0009875387|nr:polysaccharide deacetylase family protein [Anaerosalibacter sp. Marseille-P3206]